jgi:hypothetical protein
MNELFFDLETMRTTNPVVIKRIQESIRPPGQYKKPESIAQWMRDEAPAAALEQINRTALSGTFGHLAVIGWAVDDQPFEYVTAQGLQEAHMIRDFMARVAAKMHSQSLWTSQAKFIVFGDFDIRFLFQRSRILNVPLRLPMKRYSDQVFDVMEKWGGREMIKQSDIELAMGIERNDPLPFGGSQVGEAIDAGRWHDVIEHCRIDVENLRKIYRRIEQ